MGRLIILALLVSCSEPERKPSHENLYFNEEITEIEMQVLGCKREIVDGEDFWMCPDGK